MDQIQVNIPLLLLLVAVKSKPCLWREESACGYKAYSQPCVVSTVQSARPLDSRPWGYRLLKWSSVPSITSLYYLCIQEKRNKLFIEPLRASCRALGQGNYCDISDYTVYCTHIVLHCLSLIDFLIALLIFSILFVQCLAKTWMVSEDAQVIETWSQCFKYFLVTMYDKFALSSLSAGSRWAQRKFIIWRYL